MKSFFVSSTFRDMQAERDRIQDTVLPALRNWLKDTGEDIMMLDLRWGVDTLHMSEEESSRQVLKVCIDAIDRCRPYVIVLLGERYGWIPDEETVYSTDDQRITDQYEPGMSVTNLEIQYSVLNGHLPADHCIFCFRDPSVTEEIEPEYRSIYASESRMHQARMDALKETVLARKDCRIIHYSAVWDEKRHMISGLECFCEQLENALKQMIGEEINHEPDAYRLQKMTEAAAANYRSYYAVRHADEGRLLQMIREIREHTDVYHRLDTEKETWKEYIVHTPPAEIWLDEEGRPHGGIIQRTPRSRAFRSEARGILVQGPSGSGKSAFMARMEYLCRTELHMDTVLYFGGMDGCQGSRTLIDYLIRTLEERRNLQHRESDHPMEYLRQLAEKQVIRDVIIIDALDQILAQEPDTVLSLQEIMPYAFFIYSCTEDFPVRFSKPEQVWNFHLHALSTQRRKQVIALTAQRRGKHLDAQLTDRTAGMEESGMPLYLSMVMQRLFMMDAEEFTAAEQLAAGMEGLHLYMEQVISQLPQSSEKLAAVLLQYAAEKKDLEMMMDAACMTALAEPGLYENQILDLLEIHGSACTPLQFSRYVTYLFDTFMQDREGAWHLSHRIYREGLVNNMTEQQKADIYALFCTYALKDETFCIQQGYRYLLKQKHPRAAELFMHIQSHAQRMHIAEVLDQCLKEDPAYETYLIHLSRNNHEAYASFWLDPAVTDLAGHLSDVRDRILSILDREHLSLHNRILYAQENCILAYRQRNLQKMKECLEEMNRETDLSDTDAIRRMYIAWVYMDVTKDPAAQSMRTDLMRQIAETDFAQIHAYDCLYLMRTMNRCLSYTDKKKGPDLSVLAAYEKQLQRTEIDSVQMQGCLCLYHAETAYFSRFTAEPDDVYRRLHKAREITKRLLEEVNLLSVLQDIGEAQYYLQRCVPAQERWKETEEELKIWRKCIRLSGDQAYHYDFGYACRYLLEDMNRVSLEPNVRHDFVLRFSRYAEEGCRELLKAKEPSARYQWAVIMTLYLRKWTDAGYLYDDYLTVSEEELMRNIHKAETILQETEKDAALYYLQELTEAAGEYKLRHGCYAEAEMYLRKYSQTAEKKLQFRTLYYLTFALFEQNKDEEALNILEKMRTLEPDEQQLPAGYMLRDNAYGETEMPSVMPDYLQAYIHQMHGETEPAQIYTAKVNGSGIVMRAMKSSVDGLDRVSYVLVLQDLETVLHNTSDTEDMLDACRRIFRCIAQFGSVRIRRELLDLLFSRYTEMQYRLEIDAYRYLPVYTETGAYRRMTVPEKQYYEMLAETYPVEYGTSQQPPVWLKTVMANLFTDETLRVSDSLLLACARAAFISGLDEHACSFYEQIQNRNIYGTEDTMAVNILHGSMPKELPYSPVPEDTSQLSWLQRELYLRCRRAVPASGRKELTEILNEHTEGIRFIDRSFANMLVLKQLEEKHHDLLMDMPDTDHETEDKAVEPVFLEMMRRNLDHVLRETGWKEYREYEKQNRIDLWKQNQIHALHETEPLDFYISIAWMEIVLTDSRPARIELALQIIELEKQDPDPCFDTVLYRIQACRYLQQCQRIDDKDRYEKGLRKYCAQVLQRALIKAYLLTDDPAWIQEWQACACEKTAGYMTLILQGRMQSSELISYLLKTDMEPADLTEAYVCIEPYMDLFTAKEKERIIDLFENQWQSIRH